MPSLPRQNEELSEEEEIADGESESILDNGSDSDSDLGSLSDYKLHPVSGKRSNQESPSPSAKKSKTAAGSSNSGGCIARLLSDEDGEDEDEGEGEDEDEDEDDEDEDEDEDEEVVDFQSKYPFLSRSFSNIGSSIVLSESGVNAGLKRMLSIGDSRAKELDDKWKELFIKEAELHHKKMTLMMEQIRIVFDL